MFDHSVWRRGTGSHNYGRVSDHDGRVSDHSVTVCFRDPERNITRMDMREMDRFPHGEGDHRIPHGAGATPTLPQLQLLQQPRGHQWARDRPVSIPGSWVGGWCLGKEWVVHTSGQCVGGDWAESLWFNAE